MEGKFLNSDSTWNARKFEYLGEFEAKIKNTLDGYSGALMGSFGQTSRASVPLSDGPPAIHYFFYNSLFNIVLNL